MTTVVRSQPRTVVVPKAPVGAPGAPGAAGAPGLSNNGFATRSAMAAYAPAGGVHVGDNAFLAEASREGTFVAETYDGTAVANDPGQGLRVASTASPGILMWSRKDAIWHPKMMGAKYTDPTQDSATALNRFFSLLAVEQPAGVSLMGDYGLSSGWTCSLPAFGTDPMFALDFGMCRMTALTTISKMASFVNLFAAPSRGRLHVRGTSYISDAFTSWTCDVGVYASNISFSTMPEVYYEGFGFAGVDIERNPSTSNSAHWPLIHGKRAGSGAPSAGRSLTANWSARVDSGSLGDVTQYSQVTVDTVQIQYIRDQVSGTIPLRLWGAWVNGKFHRATYISGTTIRFYPRFLTSLGSSGTLRYQWGGARNIEGNDSNIMTFGTVSCIAGAGGGVDNALYGSKCTEIHAEACGMRDIWGGVWGGGADISYGEGNAGNRALGTSSNVDLKFGSVPALDLHSKDIEFYAPLATRNGVEGYYPEAYPGVTVGMNGEGWHYRTKRFTHLASEAIDFNLRRTFDGMCFVANQFSDDFNFTLIAPDPAMFEQFAYNAAVVRVNGQGSNGQPTSGGTFTPPTGHTINGGAASASATFSGFRRPAVFDISFDGVNAWKIIPNKALAGTATYDPPSLAAGAKTTIQTMSLTGALMGDAVRMSFSNDLAGARVEGWVSATNTISYYFINENGANPLDLASGTVTARISQ